MKIRNKPYWIIGIIISGLGLVFARILSHTYGGNARYYFNISGITLAVIGLFIIALGIKKR